MDLPTLEGAITTVQISAMLVRNDLRIFASSQGSIQGMAAVWNDVEFKQGPQQSIDFTLRGGCWASRSSCAAGTNGTRLPSGGGRPIAPSFPRRNRAARRIFP